ncbi:MAG: CDP-diacylglycerol--serine O-phosphatidyltransferase [Pedosphaera sp.]|nr:CDP-diacylglycerol--serine O-phosphatidyltransferase [Pedosphaera sp.]MST00232.1 CDP-diacylglycerol--serine O-phosphatidyltransferase [Pedosphaera sp.]
MADSTNPSSSPGTEPTLRIYFFPNLLTAGNLFCGFLALTKIVEADPSNPETFGKTITLALFYILLACIFDLFDGRVARWGGYESPFGREFDSLADVVSFGVVPAFLVHRVVLREVFDPIDGIGPFKGYPEIGWFIASMFLICGALRLARFNCLATQPDPTGGKEFLGCPIPMAAGAVASITLFLIWLEGKAFAKGNWRYALPVLMLFLSFLMVSKVRYPTFKKFDWRTQGKLVKLLIGALIVGLFMMAWEKLMPLVLPVLFLAYLIYGFVRPFLSRQTRRDIEEDETEEPSPGPQ